MLEAFKLEKEGYIGDEDNGSLSAWFVLSSLGIYAVTPGTNQYVLGISIWDQASLNLSEGRDFQWTILNPSQVLNVVLSRQLNGQDYAAHHPDNNQTINQGQKIGTWRHQKLEEAKLNELAGFSLVDNPHLTLCY